MREFEQWMQFFIGRYGKEWYEIGRRRGCNALGLGIPAENPVHDHVNWALCKAACDIEYEFLSDLRK